MTANISNKSPDLVESIVHISILLTQMWRHQMTSQISKFGTVCKIAHFLASKLKFRPRSMTAISWTIIQEQRRAAAETTAFISVSLLSSIHVSLRTTLSWRWCPKHVLMIDSNRSGLLTAIWLKFNKSIFPIWDCWRNLMTPHVSLMTDHINRFS